MSRILGAVALAAIALFMLVGFLNADIDASRTAIGAAFFLTIVLPALGAIVLFRGHFDARSRVAGHKAALRRQTAEAEVLRLAAARGGKLMAVEVATALAMAEDTAREALDVMVSEGRAELEVTDSGHLVYSFPTLAQLGEKGTATNVLDA